MNWEAIGAIGEMLGAAGVILTLLYLSIQVRQNKISTDRNTQMLKVAATNSLNQSFLTMTASIVQNNDFSRTFGAGIVDRLQPHESTQFVVQLSNYVSTAETAFEHFRDGALSENIWERYLEQLLDILSSPGGQHFWNLRSRHYRGEFKELLVSRLESHEGQTMYPIQSSKGVT